MEHLYLTKIICFITFKVVNLQYEKKTRNMNQLIIDLFNKAIPTTHKLNFGSVNKESTKLGYIVHPDVCNPDVVKWLDKQRFNPNSTFYKNWNDIVSKNRLELFLDQIKHYASTYGTGFTGDVYLPEGSLEIPNITEFKVITPITKEEVISRCENMLFSGIALKEETMKNVLDILNWLNHKIDVDKVKNKEAKMILCKNYNLLPSDATELVRYLVYLHTNSTLLIKSPDVIKTISANRINITKIVNQFGEEKLASVFFRFKPIFLAFKKYHANAKLINKLRRLANKFHKPMAEGFFETLLSNKENVYQLENRLKTINNFKKISLLQTINVRLKELGDKVYLVRNQKIFIKPDQNYKYTDTDYLKVVYSIIYEDLVNSLREKACKIRLPQGVNLTLPTSEKSFIGNYPIGSSFDFSDSDNIIGINWREEDGASDLDLSLTQIDGKKYGWNAAYTNENNSIIYSGDMTSANPESTELFYAKNGVKPCIVKVNLFRGYDKSKFKFFIAKEKITGNNFRNHMVNPNNILITVDCEMDSKEKTLGVVGDNKFILAQFRSGKGAVSGDSVTNRYTEYAMNTLDTYVDMRKVLTDAGFTFVEKESEAEIDLTKLSKDSLIDLFDKNKKVELNKVAEVA